MSDGTRGSSRKAGGLLLPDDDVLGAGGDHRDDLVAIQRAVRGATGLVGARRFPGPAAAIPFVRATLPGGVDDREPFLARGQDQPLDVVERHPGILAA